MSRKVSFVVLLAILAVVAAMFYRVMAGFLLPLFLALLLVVIFRPLYLWLVGKCRGRERLAAALTTAAIVLIILIPMLLILAEATREGVGAVKELGLTEFADRNIAEDFAQQVDRFNEHFANTHFHLRISPEEAGRMADGFFRETLAWAQRWFGPVLLDTTLYAAGFLVGLFIMVVALYYFLADGPKMVDMVMRLSSLNPSYGRQLIQKFETITRAVVVATIVSAVSQGLLAGLGYYLAGLNYLFMLTLLTTLLAMVPFVGSAAVWVPCCLFLYLYEGRPLAAVLLAVYGVAIVSMVDNVIKPMVLHGRSNLHPLLAMLSILGGAKTLGPIGIFIGPMVVIFFHALLVMVEKEVDVLSSGPSA